MAAEVLACAVPPLLDALVAVTAAAPTAAKLNRRRAAPHLDTLFSLVLPSAPSATMSPPPAYLLAYWCKAVTIVARQRPAALLRYLDATPGLAASLVGCHGHHGIVAPLLSRLIALPWHPASRAPRTALCFARLDAAAAATALAGELHDVDADYGLVRGSIPDVMLSALESATGFATMAAAPAATATVDASNAREGGELMHPLLEAGAGAQQLGLALISRARHVADVIAGALQLARAQSPHAKYATPGYNAATLQHRGPSTTTSDASGVGSKGGMHDDQPPPVEVAAALSAANLQLDATFCDRAVRRSDNFNLRLLKALRDAPTGARRLIGAVATVVSALNQSAASGADAPPTSLAAATEAVCVAACAALESAAVSYRQQVVLDFGAPTGGADVNGGSGMQLGPAPAVVVELLPHLPALVGFVASRVAVAAPASTSTETAPAPSSPAAPRLGIATLAIIRVLAVLTRCGWAVAATAAVRARVLSTLLDALAAYPWHSVLHRIVADAVGEALTLGAEFNLGLRRALLFDAALLTRIAGGCRVAGMPRGAAAAAALGVGVARSGVGGPVADRLQPALPVKSKGVKASTTTAVGGGGGVPPAALSSATIASPARASVGYGGHLVVLANALLSIWSRGGGDGDDADAATSAGDASLPPLLKQGAPPPLVSGALRTLLASHSEWWDAVDGQIALANCAAGLLLSGAMAPDVKKSGQVGAAADAVGGGAPSRGAVDEVAALELKTPAPGYDSDEEEEENGGAEHGTAPSFIDGASMQPAVHRMVINYGSDEDDDDLVVGQDLHGLPEAHSRAALRALPDNGDAPEIVSPSQHDDVAFNFADFNVSTPATTAVAVEQTAVADFDDFGASASPFPAAAAAWDSGFGADTTPLTADVATNEWEIGDGGRPGDNDDDVSLVGGSKVANTRGDGEYGAARDMPVVQRPDSALSTASSAGGHGSPGAGDSDGDDEDVSRDDADSGDAEVADASEEDGAADLKGSIGAAIAGPSFAALDDEDEWVAGGKPGAAVLNESWGDALGTAPHAGDASDARPRPTGTADAGATSSIGVDDFASWGSVDEPRHGNSTAVGAAADSGTVAMPTWDDLPAGFEAAPAASAHAGLTAETDWGF